MRKGRWFLNPLRLQGPARAAASVKKGMPIIVWQLIVYIALVVGIAASSFFSGYRAGVTEWEFSWWAALFAVIVGFILLPGIVDSNQPPGIGSILLELSKAFTYGIGWETLLATAIKAVTG